MAGPVEEAGKVATSFLETMRGQPLVLVLALMNVALLLFLFYYLSRITSRTETTAAALFTAQDKLFTQWGAIIKDTNDLTEKTIHCILPDDALKLLQAPVQRPPPVAAPERPSAPAPLPRDERGELKLPMLRLADDPKGD
jgi:hypothetical protein